MKIREGFVSNSSSTSFAIKTNNENKEDTLKIVLCDYNLTNDELLLDYVLDEFLDNGVTTTIINDDFKYEYIYELNEDRYSSLAEWLKRKLEDFEPITTKDYHATCYKQ